MAQNVAEVYNNTAITSSIFRYRASGFYVLGQEKYPIDYTNIRSIVIDHDYESNNMPLVYIIFNLSSKLIDTIIKNKETGVFIITIQKCVDNSDMPNFWKDYISDTFLYFLTEDINKTDQRDYENKNEGREDIYKEITVGMLSQPLVNSNRKSVNGILKCNNMMSAVVYVASSGRPLVIEPFENNSALNQVFLPPKTSVAKSIEYLNGIRTFYNTPYRYYMDFDCSYILSGRGIPVAKKGDKIVKVLFTVKDDYNFVSKLQGMEMDESLDHYNIEIGASNVDVADYAEGSKNYTKMRYTNTSGRNGDLETTPVIQGANYVSKGIHVRVPNDNPGLLTNSENSGGFYVAMNKTDLDGSIFTPNKEFTINMDEVYKGMNYTGRFLLKRKRELFFKSTGNTADNKLTMSILLFFEKV